MVKYIKDLIVAYRIIIIEYKNLNKFFFTRGVEGILVKFKFWIFFKKLNPLLSDVNLTT